MTDDPFAFLDEPIAPTDARAHIPDWFLDELPGADEAKAAHDYGYHLTSALKNPKKMETVRRHFLREMQFLRRLSEIHPEVFDEVICAYAERSLIFDQPNAA